MNCLQFRRAIETDPNHLGALERGHAEQCRVCAEHARHLREFNRALDTAMKVPVPENLADKILLRHSFRSRMARRIPWSALAASLILLTGIALVAMSYLHQETQLKHEVIALVDAAEYALQARGPVTAQTLAMALEPVGLQISGPIGAVSFAGRCLVRGKLSGHVVLRDANSPITVFLMPEENLVRQSRIEGANWSGLLVPASNGAVAIVAPRGQNVDEVKMRVLSAVRWPT